MNIDSDQVAQLLVELGERTPRIESIVQEAGAPRWAIELEDGLIVFAELDQERSRLSLETDLGQPPDEHRLATCEALMMLTSLEHATAGIATALSEPHGAFQLCGHALLKEFAPADLQSVFISFADHARHCQEIVARGAQQNLIEESDFSNHPLLA
ncbi:type III secretion system chaperone [Variovorax sp. RA8]|uniref:type III secretion system chaperone n=1 Tax=Variovorax sp. (strain JCM 16519 / RA8) TaxID=662548 RepID=UPI000A54AA59|nr:type III secretion system chaperone [Variovorax sp. RA8]